MVFNCIEKGFKTSFQDILKKCAPLVVFRETSIIWRFIMLKIKTLIICG